MKNGKIDLINILKYLMVLVLVMYVVFLISREGSSDVPVDTIEKNITKVMKTKGMSKGSAQDLKKYYGLNANDYDGVMLYIPNDVMSVNEVLVVKVKDESQIEDIENFASVFYTAKRTGGDMNRVIQKVTRMLGDKIDVKREIEATLAAKKSEQMIMSLMPVGIILYLQMTSPGFLSVLYGNPFGIAAMSICLAIYAAAYWMGRKIVDIEV